MSASQPTSPTLLQRLRAGEEGAWDRLLHLYGPLVHAWVTVHGLELDSR